MGLIKNMKKIKWRYNVIIVVVILIGIIIGVICHNNHLQKQLKNVSAELKSVETQMDKAKKDLESTKNELNTTYEEIEKYKKDIEDKNAKWKQRYKEYPVATEVWVAMKAQGWSDTVCAGIMGNLMAETGGGTLNLDWKNNNSSGYGLVQWTGNRCKTIKKKYGTYPSAKEQVQFIHDELYGVNDVSRQVTDNQLNAIIKAETPEDCAYAFACYYERCATKYRSIRKGFAQTAYNYFVD